MSANPNNQDTLVADSQGNGMLVDQQALVGNSNANVIATTYTAGAAPASGTTQTIANSATPTVVELLQYCVNLEVQLKATRDAMIAHGLMADA